MISDMLSKHVGAVKSVLKKWFKINDIQLVHLLVVWYLVNLQDARCNNKDNTENSLIIQLTFLKCNCWDTSHHISFRTITGRPSAYRSLKGAEIVECLNVGRLMTSITELKSFLMDVIIRNQDIKKLETTCFGLTLAIFRFHLEKLFVRFVTQRRRDYTTQHQCAFA